MFKLFTTEYVKDGVTPVQYPWGTEYRDNWKEVKVINKKAVALYLGIMMTVIMAVVSFMIIGGNDNTVSNIPTTTLVDEPSTTEVEVQDQTEAVIGNVIYGPEWTPKDLYVCNTETYSTEYHFQDDQYEFADGVQREIPWSSLLQYNIVMLWSMDDDSKYADFQSDIDLFNEYTHAGVRVEKYGYVAQENDFIVPVVSEDIEGDFAWADMGVRVSVSWLFGIETVSILEARFRFDQLGLNNWEYHTHTVLHEMGHLFGLGHTHDGEGQQTDSIMSYESDYEFAGYLPGDIAGLKEVFCN